MHSQPEDISRINVEQWQLDFDKDHEQDTAAFEAYLAQAMPELIFDKSTGLEFSELPPPNYDWIDTAIADLACASNREGKPGSTASDVRVIAEPFDPRSTKHTTIRIPNDVLDAFRLEAPRRSMKCQSLMIETLRAAVLKW